MSFSDREKFLFHCAVAMTMSTMNKQHPLDLQGVIEVVREGRCRSLTEDDVNSLYEDITEEVNHGQSIYEEMIAKLRGEDVESLR